MKTYRQLGTIFLLIALIGGIPTTLLAQSDNARANRIVGVWDVQNTLNNCDTGATITHFRALHKYELGGTAQLVPATNPAMLSAHVGVWTEQEKNSYQLTFKMFRFDAQGTNIGWFVVRANVVINDDATQYAGSARAQTFDVNGNLTGESCPSFTGVRLQ